MYRYYHLKNLLEAFENYFITNNEIHNYSTRNATKLHKCCKKTNYVVHTLSNKGIDLWNTLDPNHKIVKSYNVYKRLIKQHFILKSDHP